MNFYKRFSLLAGIIMSSFSLTYGSVKNSPRLSASKKVSFSHVVTVCSGDESKTEIRSVGNLKLLNALYHLEEFLLDFQEKKENGTVNISLKGADFLKLLQRYQDAYTEEQSSQECSDEMLRFLLKIAYFQQQDILFRTLLSLVYARQQDYGRTHYFDLDGPSLDLSSLINDQDLGQKLQNPLGQIVGAKKSIEQRKERGMDAAFCRTKSKILAIFEGEK